MCLFLGVVASTRGRVACFVCYEWMYCSSHATEAHGQKRKKPKLKAQIDNGTDASGTSKEVCR